MFKIVSTKPKTKKELRRERATDDVVMNRSAIFSIYFTRSMLALCLVMLGALFGMKISDYYWERYWVKQEENLLAQTKLNNMQSAQETVAGLSSYTPTTAPPTAPALASPPLSDGTVATIAPPATPPNSYITDPGIPTTPITPVPPAAAPAPITSTSNAEFDQQLANLRAERELLDQQFARLNPGSAPDSLAQPRTNQEFGGDPEADRGPARQILPEALEMTDTSRVTPAEQRIIDAPALATVADYNSDWQFVVLDGGVERNITKGQKFAVRRGGEIICTVQVSDVDNRSATADLLGRARNDPKEPKPQKGDDVIGYPLF